VPSCEKWTFYEIFRINMDQKQPQDHTLVRDRMYIFVWIALLILTGVTIAAAQLQMGNWSMVANILIASTKAGLVLWFFMHLKYENRLLRYFFLIPIVTLTVIIGLTFFDIWYR
jgi:cytochrome c oxidase subunit 4